LDRLDRRRFNWLMAGALAAPKLAIGAPVAKGVRFSFMLWAIKKLAPFDRCVEIVAEAGYQGIELTGEFQSWSAADRTRIMANMRSHGMVFDSMSGVRAGFAVPADTELFLAQFADHLRAAKELECPQVILLSGKRVDGLDAMAQRGVAVENLKRAAEMAAKAGIEIVIESIDYFEQPTIFLATVSEGFAIAEAVNAPNLTVLYDFFHEQRSFGNLLEKLEKNIHRVGLILVADVPGRHEPGTGEIDYTVIYRKLAELNYNRWIAMEYYPTSEPVASLKQSRLTALTTMGDVRR
jgi:hydroxypyruvate isomerase